ncbi:MAG: ABC transporter permease [Candidatus Hodarchaeota archaeon]
MNEKKRKVKKSGARQSNPFLRIFKMVGKEFKLIRTDIPNLMLALVIPPIIILAFSMMMSFTTSVPPVKAAIISYDSNSFFEENATIPTTVDNYTIPLVDAFNQSKSIELLVFHNASVNVTAMDEVYSQLYANKIDVIVVIPVEFSEFLSVGYPGILESIPDASNLLQIQANLNALQEGVDIFVQNNNLTPFFIDTPIALHEIPSGYNPAFNENMGMVMPFMMIGISMVLTILVVVQEKPIPRLLLTPVKKSEILASKYITYTILLLIQSALVLSVSMGSGLYIVGKPIHLFGALFAIGFSGVSLGMLISSLSNTKTEANQLFFAFLIVLVLLSGIFIPVDNMPGYLQWLAESLPLSHGSPLINSITTKGENLQNPHFFILLGISGVLVILSFIIFAKKRVQV